MIERTPQVTPEMDTNALRQEIMANTDRHQFLGAGAGAGKTTVLVGHYFELLRAGLRPSQLVAVTFTDKAAAEMKARLREKCREKAVEARDARDLSADDWEGLLHEIETAPISTIHALCARLLRENSLAAGLDPDFAVLDEIDSRILLDDVVRRTLLSRLGKEPTADSLVVALGYDEAVSHITKLVQDRVQVEAVLADTRYDTEEALLGHWQELGRQYLAERLHGMLESDEWVDAMAIVTAKQEPQKPATDALERKRIAVAQCIDKSGLLNWTLEAGPEAIAQAVVALAESTRAVGAVGNAGAAGVWGTALAEMRAALRLFLNKEGLLQTTAAEIETLQSQTEDDRACARLTCALVAEVKAAIGAYAQAKDEASALDFEDLMERTRWLWQEHPEALERTRRGLRHVMIDEFQDTNTLQKQVLWPLVTGEPYDPANPVALPEKGVRLFVVGDAKQSIYRFRNADVTVFNATRREMLSGASRVDELTRNFRSTQGLIGVFNELFAHPAVMGEEAENLWEATYAKMQAVRGNPADQTPLEIHLLTEQKGSRGESAGNDSDEGEEIDTTSLRTREARWIAGRLVELLQSGDFRVQHEKGEDAPWEPIRPGDIAILFRAMKDVALYEQALRDAGLPYYLVVGRGFFAAQEVQDVANVLRAIENELDDIALVGALRSPMFGLSDETLYRLGQIRVGSWMNRLRTAAIGSRESGEPGPEQLVDPDQKELVIRAFKILQDFHDHKNRLPLSALVQRIVDRTGFTAVLAGQFGGRQMVSNVRKLVELAGEFEAGQKTQGRGSLRDFVEHIRRMTTDEVREGQAPIEEEAGDCIKLITYHSAKGLQWPVVVVPDLCRKPGGGFSLPYRHHRDFGLVVKTTRLRKQENGDSYWPALGRQIDNRNKAEEDAENRRLFYVAATRAQDLLILSGVAFVNKDGGMSKDAEKGPLGWINEALPGCLWMDAGNPPQETLRRWDNGSLIKVEGLAAGEATYEASPSAQPTAKVPDTRTLARRIAAISPAATGQAHFTATELSQYCHCPRLYELQTRLGLPAGAPAFGSGSDSSRLNSVELGTVVHRVLQLVGTEGLPELDRLVPPDADMLYMDTLLDKRAAEERQVIRRQVQQFLDHDLYKALFTSSSRLRSEVGLTTLIDVDGLQVVVEGKIDALVETEDGKLHLLDYKTGREDMAKDRQYRVQLGLYCHAVLQARGVVPESARLVYLSRDGIQTPDLGPVTDLMDSALDSARVAVRGIWQGDFSRREVACDHCPGRWLCRHTAQVAGVAASGAGDRE
ncbi:MAG: UvrD-helicase domain-containing protein [Armatimonadetes bacterium]|nr:UvrD-helicase domain-containing protein [Armatimonadota bacterium]